MPELPDLDELDVAATACWLARQQATIDDWSVLAERPAGELAVLFAVREYGPIRTPELWERHVVANGTASNVVRRLEDDGLLARRDPTGGRDALWCYDPARHADPVTGDRGATTTETTTESDYTPARERWANAEVVAEVGEGVQDGEPITDGGQVQACPECDRSGNIHHRIGSVQGPDARSDRPYFCGFCGADFDEPVKRPSNEAGGGLRGAARTLDEADPDETLPDGGHPVARPDQPALESYSFRLPDELIAQVDTLLEIGLYASRSEAIRSAIRREIRLQAGERDAVAETLQRTYDVAMDGRRPETIGSLERLADQLGVDLERRVAP